MNTSCPCGGEYIAVEYRGTPEDAAKMEQRIFNAIRDGHVLEK